MFQKIHEGKWDQQALDYLALVDEWHVLARSEDVPAEPFHAEFKTDMGLERLPSGKFDTKDLVCQMACVAMALLRLIGTHILHGKRAPVRHAAQRRRIRMVMQERTDKAARLIRHAGRWVLGLAEDDSGAEVFARHDGQLVTR